MDREPVWGQAILVIAASEAENQRVIMNKAVGTMQRFFNGAAADIVARSAAYQVQQEKIPVSTLICLFFKNRSFYKTMSSRLLDIHAY